MSTLRARFERIGWNVDFNGCWNWSGVKVTGGYGRIRGDGGRSAKLLLAHRVSYTLYVGEIPENLLVRHSCDNGACVNPQHLLLGNQVDNMRDRRERKRLILKLTDDAILKVRQLASIGMKHTEIAEKFGISQPYVSQIVANRRRKYVGHSLQ